MIGTDLLFYSIVGARKNLPSQSCTMETSEVFTPEQIEMYKNLLATKPTDTLDSYEFFYEGNGFKSWRKLVGVGLLIQEQISIRFSYF